MKILVTGGCGNMGVHTVKALMQRGHEVRVLDRDAEGMKQFDGTGAHTLVGDFSSQKMARKAVKGMDAILHLAWSFSEDLTELLDTDVKGYKYLLDAALEFGVQRVINTTTAVSYGKPLTGLIDENHPHLIEKSRNPIYALAKQATEDLGKIYATQHGMSVNNVMIWYAYGDVIGGRNLRTMVKDAIEKGVIEVPAGSGGSFLQIDDFVSGVLAIFEAGTKGELFNFGTVYLTWEELARLIVAQANPAARVDAIPQPEWTGSHFLLDDWHFSTKKAELMVGYQSAFNREQAIAHLSKALEGCVAGVKAKLK